MARFALDLLEFAKRERVKEVLETNLPDIDEKDTKKFVLSLLQECDGKDKLEALLSLHSSESYGEFEYNGTEEQLDNEIETIHNEVKKWATEVNVVLDLD